VLTFDLLVLIEDLRRTLQIAAEGLSPATFMALVGVDEDARVLRYLIRIGCAARSTRSRILLALLEPDSRRNCVSEHPGNKVVVKAARDSVLGQPVDNPEAHEPRARDVAELIRGSALRRGLCLRPCQGRATC